MLSDMSEKHIKAGRKGGIIKWARVGKKKRTAIMREVAIKGWVTRKRNAGI
jgi:predicted GIY-YIG superfamily endonuclease